MLRINKAVGTLDTNKIGKLGKNWECSIPKRPDFPKGYFDGDEEKVPDDDYDAWACPSCEHESPGKCGFCGMCGRQKPAKADSDSDEGSSVEGGA